MRGKKTKTVKFLRREGIVPALPIVLVGSFTTFYCDFIRIRRLKVVYKESRTFPWPWKSNWFCGKSNSFNSIFVICVVMAGYCDSRPSRTCKKADYFNIHEPSPLIQRPVYATSAYLKTKHKINNWNWESPEPCLCKCFHEFSDEIKQNLPHSRRHSSLLSAFCLLYRLLRWHRFHYIMYTRDCSVQIDGKSHKKKEKKNEKWKMQKQNSRAASAGTKYKVSSINYSPIYTDNFFVSTVLLTLLVINI